MYGQQAVLALVEGGLGVDLQQQLRDGRVGPGAVQGQVQRQVALVVRHLRRPGEDIQHLPHRLHVRSRLVQRPVSCQVISGQVRSARKSLGGGVCACLCSGSCPLELGHCRPCGYRSVSRRRHSREICERFTHWCSGSQPDLSKVRTPSACTCKRKEEEVGEGGRGRGRERARRA